MPGWNHDSEDQVRRNWQGGLRGLKVMWLVLRLRLVCSQGSCINFGAVFSCLHDTT